MFDISFGEMLLIGIVALVVIGPEKLPSVARTLGALVGRMQRYVNDVKADIQRETSMSELKQLGAEVTSAAQNLRDSVTRQVDEVQASVESVRQDLTEPVAEAGQAVQDAVTATADELAAATEAARAAVAPDAVPADGDVPARSEEQLDLFEARPQAGTPPPAAAGDTKPQTSA
ncbi:Sec-independent protein translocase protein TatB [Laribacter hongkongensis]|uniref:Sec-independent protein translocase protein TatB n=1 Tax=Laribacter hongkongensis TaxID=168471 RepID=UPI001EFCEC57|nr:Sec-independent protein translocase protein TatB [Laribacter hongkongensis]MCG9098446.1 Sec-independent protein translocase protein TatB [Laribacter hongkongensis]MCG9124674.1 Sec-independent protein translocase protein TatB [Laribacter hongkongensis]